MTIKAGKFNSKFVVSKRFFKQPMSAGFDDAHNIAVMSIIKEYQCSVEIVKKDGGTRFGTKKYLS